MKAIIVLLLSLSLSYAGQYIQYTQCIKGYMFLIVSNGTSISVVQMYESVYDNGRPQPIGCLF